jgi:hypothetical protein
MPSPEQFLTALWTLEAQLPQFLEALAEMLAASEAVKTELSLARQGLNGTVRLWIWGLLFLIWTPVFRVGWPLLLGGVDDGVGLSLDGAGGADLWGFD